MYHMPNVVARETLLQSFHFKIVNRYIACQSNLHKWKKVTSPNCQECKESDTVEHHLYTCKKLQHFWIDLFSWLESVYGLKIHMTVLDIVFGIANDSNDKLIDVFNYCILFAKNFIYNCQIGNKK